MKEKEPIAKLHKKEIRLGLKVVKSKKKPTTKKGKNGKS